MNEKRKKEQRRADQAAPQSERNPIPQPKKQDEELDEQALDEVLRDCPL